MNATRVLFDEPGPRARRRIAVATVLVSAAMLVVAVLAAQSLAVARELGFDEEKMNVNGGAIALGHPLGCSGAKLTATAIYELRRRGGGKALITMCIGGGMGAAGVIEVFPEEGAGEQAAD